MSLCEGFPNVTFIEVQCHLLEDFNWLMLQAVDIILGNLHTTNIVITKKLGIYKTCYRSMIIDNLNNDAAKYLHT